MKQDVTRILSEVREGSADAREELFATIYDQLRVIAGGLLQNERPGHTYRPTDLVQEACVRLCDGTLSFEGRRHFLNTAARVMRHVLVDHARSRLAAKRGQGAQKVEWEGLDVPSDALRSYLEIDEVLDKLEAHDSRKALVVHLKYFCFYSVDEIAEAVGVSPRTVDVDLRIGRAFLRRELAVGDNPGESSPDPTAFFAE